jgi:glyoxylase-like metal-dependent hydrolase (beta-lactamase superfamily II)
MTLRAVVVPVTPFVQNCSVVWCNETGRGAVIDPGGDVERILEVVKTHDVALEKILLTHAHIDHAGGVAELARRFRLPIEGPQEGDRFWIEQLPQQAAMFGVEKAGSFEPTRWLRQGDSVTVGNVTLEVRHCPGHTPGHVVFYEPGARLAFVGDVLFAGSVGRTDFPGGDYETLVRSIRGNLFPLGDDVRFVPGHGPMSTFGEERKSNPFVGDGVVSSEQ